MDTEQFNKCTISLWSHGLVTFSKIILSSVRIDCKACVEVHDVIAQYIFDEMPYKFCTMIKMENTYQDDLDFLISDEVVDVQEISSIIDEIIIPSIINFLAVGTRGQHIEFTESVNELIDSHPQLLETNTMMGLFKDTQPLPMKKVYKNIQDNCKTIQSLLANNKHDEAISWFGNFLDAHPIVATYSKIGDFYRSLHEECSHMHDSELMTEIDKMLSSHHDGGPQDIRVIVGSFIMCRAEVVLMISSGVPSDEIREHIAKYFDES